MSKQQFMAGDEVWPTLQRLARRSSGPKWVASAYLGDRAGDAIRLGKGDTLLVALTEANAKNGSVSPHEISQLMDRGVRVFTDKRLHAKVYLFGNVLAVGSANLSSNSISVLEESMLVSREPRAIRDARRWFKRRCRTPVTPEWLDRCKSVYKAPRRVQAEERLWLVGVSAIDFPRDEQPVWKAAEAEAEQQVSHGYHVDTVRFPGSSLFVREVKRGDFVIQVCRDGRGKRVYPHARVLETRKTRSARGAKVLYVSLELPTEPRTVAWSAFKRGMAEAGVLLGRDVGTREIKRAMQVAMDLTRCVP